MTCFVAQQQACSFRCGCLGDVEMENAPDGAMYQGFGSIQLLVPSGEIQSV